MPFKPIDLFIQLSRGEDLGLETDSLIVMGNYVKSVFHTSWGCPVLEKKPDTKHFLKQIPVDSFCEACFKYFEDDAAVTLERLYATPSEGFAPRELLRLKELAAVEDKTQESYLSFLSLVVALEKIREDQPGPPAMQRFIASYPKMIEECFEPWVEFFAEPSRRTKFEEDALKRLVPDIKVTEGFEADLAPVREAIEVSRERARSNPKWGITYARRSEASALILRTLYPPVKGSRIIHAPLFMMPLKDTGAIAVTDGQLGTPVLEIITGLYTPGGPYRLQEAVNLAQAI